MTFEWEKWQPNKRQLNQNKGFEWENWQPPVPEMPEQRGFLAPLKSFGSSVADKIRHINIDIPVPTNRRELSNTQHERQQGQPSTSRKTLDPVEIREKEKKINIPEERGSRRSPEHERKGAGANIEESNPIKQGLRKLGDITGLHTDKLPRIERHKEWQRRFDELQQANFATIKDKLRAELQLQRDFPEFNTILPPTPLGDVGESGLARPFDLNARNNREYYEYMKSQDPMAFQVGEMGGKVARLMTLSILTGALISPAKLSLFAKGVTTSAISGGIAGAKDSYDAGLDAQGVTREALKSAIYFGVGSGASQKITEFARTPLYGFLQNNINKPWVHNLVNATEMGIRGGSFALAGTMSQIPLLAEGEKITGEELVQRALVGALYSVISGGVSGKFSNQWVKGKEVQNLYSKTQLKNAGYREVQKNSGVWQNPATGEMVHEGIMHNNILVPKQLVNSYYSFKNSQANAPKLSPKEEAQAFNKWFTKHTPTVYKFGDKVETVMPNFAKNQLGEGTRQIPQKNPVPPKTNVNAKTPETIFAENTPQPTKAPTQPKTAQGDILRPESNIKPSTPPIMLPIDTRLSTDLNKLKVEIDRYGMTPKEFADTYQSILNDYEKELGVEQARQNPEYMEYKKLVDSANRISNLYNPQSVDKKFSFETELDKLKQTKNPKKLITGYEKRQKEIEEELFKYMKSQSKQGVLPRQPIWNEDNEIVRWDKGGSLNDKWYRDLRAFYGRTPPDYAIRDLAKEFLERGWNDFGLEHPPDEEYIALKKLIEEGKRVQPKEQPQQDIKLKDPKPLEVKPVAEVKKANTKIITATSNDLPMDFLENAFSGTNFNPKARAEYEQKSYLDHMEEVENRLTKLANTPEQEAMLKQELPKYQQTYLRLLKDKLNAQSNVVSMRVSGTGNNFQSKMSKKIDREQAKNKLFIEGTTQALEKIENKLKGLDKEAPDYEVNRLKKEVNSTVATVVGIKEGKLKGYDKSAFTNGLKNKLTTSHKNGHKEAVSQALVHLKGLEEKYGVTVFAKNNSIWNLQETKPEPKKDLTLKEPTTAEVKPPTPKTADTPKNNIGYHAGDLGKAEHFGRFFGSNRSTGHFGTGTYFVGDKSKVQSGSFKDRPQHEVDLSKYNLFKPINEKVARKLHDDILKFVNSGEYELSQKDIIPESVLEDLEYAEPDVLAPFLKKHGVLDETAFEVYTGIKLDKYLSEQIENKQAKNFFDDKYKEIVKLNNRIENAKDNKKSFDETVESVLSITKEKANQVLRKITDDVNKELKGKDFYTLGDTAKTDSLSTRFMKELGYEGIDVRHLPSFDNTDYGTVVYDLKQPQKDLSLKPPTPKPVPEKVPESVKPPKKETSLYNVPTTTEELIKVTNDFSKLAREGKLTLQAYQDYTKLFLNNEEAIQNVISKLTVKQLRNMIGRIDGYLPDSSYKKDTLVEMLYNRFLERTEWVTEDLERMTYIITGSMGETKKQKLEYYNRMLEKVDQGYIDKFNEKRAVKVKEQQKEIESIKKPETLDELKQAKHYRKLTPEEQDKLEDLQALARKERLNKQSTSQQEKAVQMIEQQSENFTISKTKHTKTNEDLWVVKPNDKLPKDEFTSLNNSIKKLGGYYSRYTKGFTFKQDPAPLLEGEFKPATTGETKKELTNVEKLRTLADGLDKKLEHLRADRLTNTHKRMTEQANREAEAEGLERFQATLRNLADGIEKGEVKLLDKVSAMTELETLNSVISWARQEWLREKDPSNKLPYNEREALRQKPTTNEMIRYAEMPLEEVYKSHLQSLVNKGLETKGLKQISKKFNKYLKTDKDYIKIPNYLMKDLRALVNSLDDAKGTYIDSMFKHITRLERLGIQDDEDLRAYLREYLKFKEGKKAPTKEDLIKEKQRELFGAKIDGYFPTPKKIVEQMLDYAEIQPTDKVLEPSAGQGHIADMVKEVTKNVDVVEWNNSNSEILALKGHNVIGHDALQVKGKYDKIVMNPPFEKGQDIDHVMYAYNNNLEAGGRLVAIMSEGSFFRSDKKATGFREWLESLNGTSEKLPDGAFKESDRSTGVNTRLVVIDKPKKLGQELKPHEKLQQFSTKKPPKPKKDLSFKAPKTDRDHFKEAIDNMEKEIETLPFDLQIFVKPMLKKYQKMFAEMEAKNITKATTEEVKNLIEHKNNMGKLKHEWSVKWKEKLEKEKQKLVDYKQQQKENKQIKALEKMEQQERKDLKELIAEAKSKLKYYDPHYKEALAELVYNVDSLSLSMREKTRISLTKAKEFFEKQKAIDENYEIPEKLVNKLKRLENKFIKDMTIDEVRSLTNAIKHIMHLDKLKKYLINQKKVITLADAKNKIVEEIKNSVDPKTKAKKEQMALDRSSDSGFKKWVGDMKEYAFTVNALSPETLALKLSGGDEDSSFYKYFYEEINEGQRNKLIFIDKADQNFMDETKHLKLKDGWELEKSSIQTSKGKLTLTRDEKIELYLHSINSDNTNHIFNAGIVLQGSDRAIPLTQQDLETIKKFLTPEELTVARSIYNFFNEQGEGRSKTAINKVSMDLYGYELADVKEYFPIKTDADYRDSDFSKFGSRATLEGLGFLKERTDGASPIKIRGAIAVFNDMKEKVSSLYGYSVPLRNAKALLGHNEVKRAINNNYSKTHIEYYRRLFEQLEYNRKEQVQIEKGASKILSNTQQAILGLNPWIWLKQTASLPTAMADIEPKYIMAGLHKKVDWELAKKYSPYIKYRQKGYVTQEAGRIIDKTNTRGGKSSWTTKPIQTFDNIAIGRIWNGAIEKVKAEKPHLTGDDFYNEVARVTERVIHRTQPNYTHMQRTDVGRSDSLFVRLLTTFSTQRGQNYNIMYRAYMESQKGNHKKAIQLLSAVLGGTLLVTVIDNARSRWRNRDYSSVAEFNRNLIGNMYFVNSIYEMISSGYDPSTPLDSAIADLGRSIYNIKEFNRGRKTSFGKFMDLVSAISQLSGMPVKNVMAELDSLFKNLDADLYYDYKSLTVSVQRSDYYNHLWDAVSKGKQRDIDSLVNRLINEGVTKQNIRSSGRARGIDDKTLRQIEARFPARPVRRK